MISNKSDLIPHLQHKSSLYPNSATSKTFSFSSKINCFESNEVKMSLSEIKDVLFDVLLVIVLISVFLFMSIMIYEKYWYLPMC